MADIEGQLQFGRGLSFFAKFLGCIHGLEWLQFARLNGIKTKLDNANWFTIRQADTPLIKAFLKQARSVFCWPGLFCPASR
jgi:hypothetical protein